MNLENDLDDKNTINNETNADKTFKNIYEQIGDFEDKKIIFKLTNLKYLNSKSI